VGLAVITKKTFKAEIDKPPENLLEDVYNFINAIKTTKSKRRTIHTFKLKGQFDNINIRESAYEK